jgi:hypothetical protein
MECTYCLSNNARISLKSKSGIKYFCDRACGHAHLREKNQEDMGHNVIASFKNMLETKQDLLDLALQDIPEEEKVEKALYMREFIRYCFASKLFYQAMLNRESLETITRLKDLHIKALQGLMDTMFCSDLIKETYSSTYYHTGRLLSPQSIKTYNLMSEAFSK